MADILNLQGQDPEPTPGDEKWSGLSIGKCGKSLCIFTAVTVENDCSDLCFFSFLGNVSTNESSLLGHCASLLSANSCCCSDCVLLNVVDKLCAYVHVRNSYCKTWTFSSTRYLCTNTGST